MANTKDTKKEENKKTKKVSTANNKKDTKKVEPKKTTTKKKDNKKTTTTKKTTTKNKVERFEVEKENYDLSKTKVYSKEDLKEISKLEEKNLDEVVDNLEKDKIVLDNKIIDRKPQNKIIIIILTILMVVTAIATIIYIIKDKDEEKQDITLNSNIYDKVSKADKLVEEQEEENKNTAIKNEVLEAGAKNYKQIISLELKDFEEKILNREDMNILIGSSTCYYCISFEPDLNEELTSQNKTIYRINIATMTKAEQERLYNFYNFRLTPTIFVVKNGIVTSEHSGIIPESELHDWIEKNLI